MHPAVADGRTAWIFLEAAAACRGGTDGDATEPPAFDRAVVRLLDGEHEGRAAEVRTRSTNRKSAKCRLTKSSRKSKTVWSIPPLSSPKCYSSSSK